MNVSTLRALLVVMMLPLISLAQGGGREVDLRPKFVQGQQTRFKMEMINTSDPVRAADARPPGTKPADPALPAPERTRSKMELTFSLRVQSVNPEREATVNLVFDAIKLSTSTGEGTIEFDSSKPPSVDDDLVGALLKPLVGSTLTLRVDRAGNIISISGGEAFTALGQFAGGGGQAGDLFGPIFTARKGTGLARIGEAWENEDKIDNALIGRFKMTTRHTLRSALGGEAKVDMTGRIEPQTEAPGSGAGQIKDSSFNGSYAWDTERGMLKRMDSTMRIRMEQNAGGVRTETRNESVVRVTQVR